jgi:hypothetical protein
VKVKIKYFLIVLLGLVCLWQVSPTTAQKFTTPLEASGLTPLWEENFTDGSVDRMQFTWAFGDQDALRSHVIPGAVYMGQEGSDPVGAEHELNNFRRFEGEPLPNTLEFDVFSPTNERIRISLRPRRRGDFARIRLGHKENRSEVTFAFISDLPVTTIVYNELTGPTFGWAHVSVSYRQYVSGGTIFGHYVVAINEEVHEFTEPSGITNPDWLTYWNTTEDPDGWSMEVHSPIPTIGRYLANIRAYNGFITKAEMQTRLQGRTAGYRANLPDPRNYTGPIKPFRGQEELTNLGPHALIYTEQTGPLTVKFDGSLSSGWELIGDAYNWTFGDGTSGSGRIVNHTYSQPGTYQIQLTVATADGIDSDQTKITITGTSPSPPKLLYLPLILRPN